MFRFYTSNLTFEGSLINIGKRTTINASGITLDNYSPKGGNGLDHGGSSTSFVLNNFSPEANTRDSVLRFNNWDSIFNASTGMHLKVAPLSPNYNSQNGGGCRLYRKVSTNIKDINNNPLQDVKTFLPSYNDGNRVDLSNYLPNSISSSGWDFTQITDTILTTASNGQSSIHNQILKVWYLLTKTGSDMEVIRFDKNADDGGIFAIPSYKYGYLVQSNDYSLNGLYDLEIKKNLLPNANTIETNKTIVDAYPISISISSSTIAVTGDNTTIQNLTSLQLYDLLASYLEDNFGTYTDFLITRSGNEINANGYNVDLSYINYTGDMVTDQLITLINGSIFNGTRTDQNGTVFPPIDVTFTGLQSGSQLVVYVTGTTAEKFRTNNSGTSEQWTETYTSDITYDVTIQKTGFFPIRLTSLTASTIPITTSINQLIDRAYQTSSGLTYSTNANLNTGTKEFSVSVATTVQNYYSFWIEQWISNSALRNIKFPISTFGGSSFSFDDGYEFTNSSLSYLSRDGFRYFDSGNVTARYAAILSQGVSTGLQAEYQQAQGGSISDVQNTGNVDQVIQIYGDSTHGNFDYTNYLIFKVQANGFRQAEANIVSVFGTLEEQFYVTSLNTLAIPNFTTGNPNVTGLIISDDSANPVSWDAGDGTARDYSLTITDTNNNTGENILRWLNYNLSLDATFEGKDPFYYPEMVIDNGSSYETIRGILYGSTSNVLAGVRVIDSNGNPHRDFTRFQSDDGTYGVPIEIKTASITGITTNSRLRIYNQTTSQETFNGVITGTSYTEEYTEGNNYSQGDQLEITHTYQIGTAAKIPLISQAIVRATGWSLLVNQKDLTAYSSLGADGSTVTEYNIDSNTGNLEIDANDTDCFSSKRRLVARYYYLITTEEGINRYVNAIILEDEANAIIDRTITNLTVDNIGGCTLNLTDSDFRLYTSDGSSWIKNPPTGGYGIISDSGKVYVKGQEQLENKVDELKTEVSENTKVLFADEKKTRTNWQKLDRDTKEVLFDKYYTRDSQGNETLTEVTE